MMKLSWETTVKVFGCLCVAVTVGCLANILYQEEYLPHTQVKAEIFYLHDRYDGHKCNTYKDYPWLLVIHNDSKRTVKSMSIALASNDPGHSTDLMDGQAPIKNDEYVSPGESKYTCIHIPVMTFEDASPVNANRYVYVRDMAVKFQ